MAILCIFREYFYIKTLLIVECAKDKGLLMKCPEVRNEIETIEDLKNEGHIPGY